MMQRLAALALVLCLLSAHAASTASHKLRHDVANSIVQGIEYDQKLRVCNAYPMTSELDVYIGSVKVNSEPLGYKMCTIYDKPVKNGEKLDFKVADATVGTFTISDLPENDAKLQLIVFRHDAESTACAFESHIFANIPSSQLAVIDTYKSSKQLPSPHMTISDSANGKEARHEKLRFDSVVAINPGKYEVHLDDSAKSPAKAVLTALPGESYVAITIGTQSEDGQSFAQEVMVFPQSDPALLGAAASLHAPLILATLASLAALLMA